MDSIGVGGFAETDRVFQHGGDDAGRAIGRCGDDPAARRVLLVHGKGEEVHPIEHRQRIAGCLLFHAQ